MNISHESLHQPATDALCRESYYFNLLGPDLALETTIGLRPQQGITERMALVFYRDQTLVLIKPERLTEFAPSALQAGVVCYNCVTPLERWQVHITGDFLVLPPGEDQEITSFLVEVQKGQPAQRVSVALDLDFEGAMPPYLYPTGALDFIGSNTHHYEQVGRWTGSVHVGDDAIHPVTGLGVRDHSWGTRDWLRAEEWYWVNVLDPDEYLVLAYGRTGGENWTGSGFIHTHGVTDALQQISVAAQHDDDTTMVVGETQVEARTEDGRSALARIYRQRAVQLVPARGPQSLLRMSTNVGAAGGRMWLLQYGRRERVDAGAG